jgi:hypothetical protein
MRSRRLLPIALLFAWPSASAVAQTFTFTDDPLVPGVTRVDALHMIELRTAINVLR